MPLIDTRLPIVAAPMAGGPSTVRLGIAVAEAGGFPFLAGGMKMPEALAAEIEQTRKTGHSFGVNLFVPSNTVVEEAAFRMYAEHLAPEAERLGIALDPEPRIDDDHWAEKVDYLTRHPVPVVSFTFGLPSGEDIEALQRAGSRALATVTTPEEASDAAQLGVDGLIVQGPRAGGHSATHDPARDIADIDTADLVAQVTRVTELPLIAAGGAEGPDSVRRLRSAGAEAVAVGTLLLRTDEAGTSAIHRAALEDERFTETALTRAFTGRPARALRNDFIDSYDPVSITGYPAVHHLTRELRQAAAKAGDAERVHLWAGTGWRFAQSGPVAGVIASLAGEASVV